MADLGLLLVASVVGTALVWLGSSWLEDAAGDLAEHYGLPRLVQGTIVVAVGSSSPELASAVLSTVRHGEFELGVGVVVGSAVFNILVVPALSALAADDSFDTGRDVVYKEAQFYMLSVAALFLVLAMAVIYDPVEGEPLTGYLTRPLALALLALYGLYLFVQYLDVGDADVRTSSLEGRRLAARWALLLGGIACIVVGVEALVVGAIGLGEVFDTPSFLWGLTVVAAASSLPDAYVSISAAHADEPSVSLGNVLGSNIFDLLVAVPAGVLLAGATPVSFEAAVPMMGFLVLATVVLFAFSRTGMALSGREAAAMLLLYGGFVGWLLLESVGAVSVL